MILMALDHIRDMFHRAAMHSSPTDLTKTFPALFFTRWITHFCAPTFIFLAGVSAFLWFEGRHTRPQLSRYLLTRGLWLIFLELTVMRFAYTFNFAADNPILLIILWVLGACMVGLAALIYLPRPILLPLSDAVIALHNTLDGINAAHLKHGAALWRILHQPGAFVLSGRAVVIGYPLIPWIAVIAAGFCAGPLFQISPVKRQKILLLTGSSLSLLFLLLRFVNRYGDRFPWTHQPSSMLTLLSFLNTTKYPPSLLFLMMTLGPALAALALLERFNFRRANPLILFGRVPLFYFLVHFYLIRVLADLFAWSRYGNAARQFFFQPLPSMGGSLKLFPADFGYSLPVVYGVWLLVLVLLYPLCRWFARIKSDHSSVWLTYL